MKLINFLLLTPHKLRVIPYSMGFNKFRVGVPVVIYGNPNNALEWDWNYLILVPNKSNSLHGLFSVSYKAYLVQRLLVNKITYCGEYSQKLRLSDIVSESFSRRHKYNGY